MTITLSPLTPCQLSDREQQEWAKELQEAAQKKPAIKTAALEKYFNAS